MLLEVERLFFRRPMTLNHRRQMMVHLRSFAAWSADDFASFNDDTVNEWIASLCDQQRWKPRTLRHFRSSILNGWRTAYRAGLVPALPGDIRPVRLKRRPPEAWTTDELRSLVSACDSDPDGDWMRAYILTVWSTALRMNDVLSIRLDNLAPGNVWHLSQNKTGDAHSVRLSDEAISALEKLGGRFEHRSRFQIRKRIDRLKKASGVTRGSARWIRRSAASYVEKERPGYGSKLLGHKTPGMAEKHYFDPAIIGSVVAGPAVSLTRSVDDSSSLAS